VASAAVLAVRFPSDDVTLRDLVAAELDGTDAAAIDDADELEWRVFYQTREARDAARKTLGPFARTHRLTTASLELEDEDWARRSQAQLTAIRVGDIIVAPPWDLPAPGTLSHQARGTRHQAPTVIVIEPSVGFGTGHHASTRLCLLAMQQLDLHGKSVIDVGTGSGVLAIAAVKLGAAHVAAIDADADAVGSARENAARNSVVIECRVADLAAMDRPSLRELHPSGTFDVVLANLTAAWLRRLSAPLLALAPHRGTYVLSGIQTAEKDAVLEMFVSSRQLKREAVEEGWCALVLT
jgi:ribosomal protein L11 methyltransferase